MLLTTLDWFLLDLLFRDPNEYCGSLSGRLLIVVARARQKKVFPRFFPEIGKAIVERNGSSDVV